MQKLLACTISLAMIHELRSTLLHTLLVQGFILIKMFPILLFLLLTYINNDLRSTLRVYYSLFTVASVFLLEFITSYTLWRHVPLSSKMPHIYLPACGSTFPRVL